jgi:hypothetical protein
VKKHKEWLSNITISCRHCQLQQMRVLHVVLELRRNATLASQFGGLHVPRLPRIDEPVPIPRGDLKEEMV